MNTPPLPPAVELAVVGAGAAGLWAAARAAERGAEVLLLEKTPRAGTKILASGGTRCNLTTTLDGRAAARLFGRAGAKFLGPAFKALSPQRVREHFAALGVPTVTEPALEKVFPRSQRARDVRDALLRDALAAGARIAYESPVRGVRLEPPGFALRVGDGTVRCRKLLLCPGGKSYPKTGTVGDGYPWLRALGIALVPTVPALVPLTSPAKWVRELRGISLQDCEARLLAPSGKVVGRRRRPVLFTHQGLSGPGAMDLSEPVARDPAGGWRIALDCAPQATAEELHRALIDEARRKGGGSLSAVLPALPRRLLAALARQAGLPEAKPSLEQLSKPRRTALVAALKGLEVPVDGTLGFRKAEVTAGGVALDEVDRKTMECKRVPGLYLFGEILDLAGPIGGLNFQSAFATAHLAALAATR